jgi:hypothetical protein
MKKFLTVFLASIFLYACNSGGGNGGGGGGENTTPAILEFTNGQEAAMVIGQDGFDEVAENRGQNLPAANTLANPTSVAVSDDGVLYIADCENNRVLGFNQVPDQLNVNADFVLGQINFTSSQAGVSDRTFDCPFSARIAENKLFIVDRNNNRVLMWNNLPLDGNTPADLVLGQPDFDTNTSQCSAQGMTMPFDVHVVGGIVIVSDTSNNRGLIWQSIPTTNGQAADIVLGQPTATTCTQSTTVSANNFQSPAGVWSDGTKLAVADALNNRTLIWNTFPSENGQAADLVLGQADMQTNTGDVCDSCLLIPTYIYSAKNQLFVSDSNSRVLIWDTFPLQNNRAADRVLGQADFDTDGANAGPAGLAAPVGMHVYQETLLVADWGNHRVLIFNAP